MVIRDLEALEAYQDEDIKNSELYLRDSFSAEEFGYAIVLTTFILIVVLVCIVGLGITSPCCCWGGQVNLLSINYQQKGSYVVEISNEDHNRKHSSCECSTAVDINR